MGSRSHNSETAVSDADASADAIEPVSDVTDVTDAALGDTTTDTTSPWVNFAGELRVGLY